MPSRRTPKYASSKVPEEQYWKKPTRHEISDNDSAKSSTAETSDDDGEEKIMVERYWKREPSTHKGCEAPSGEEKIIISRLWKKKSAGGTTVSGEKDSKSNGRGHSVVSKSESSNASTDSSDDSSDSSSESGRSNDSYNSDDDYEEHYWSRKARASKSYRAHSRTRRRYDDQHNNSRNTRPAVCQKCGSCKYPRKH